MVHFQVYFIFTDSVHSEWSRMPNVPSLSFPCNTAFPTHASFGSLAWVLSFFSAYTISSLQDLQSWTPLFYPWAKTFLQVSYHPWDDHDEEYLIFFFFGAPPQGMSRNCRIFSGRGTLLSVVCSTTLMKPVILGFPLGCFLQ